MKENKNILISGYYGVNNVGDDLLLKSIIEKLFSFNPNIDISITAQSKDNLSHEISSRVKCIEPPKVHKVKFFRILNIVLHEIALFKNHDIYMYGGGTRLFETQNRSYQSLLIKYITLKVNKIFFNRKVIHLGVGIGEIYSKQGKWLLKQIMLLSDFLLIRDENSFKIAKSCLQQTDKVLLGSDLLFLNDKTYQFNNIKGLENKAKIGLSFFQYYGYISNDINRKEAFKTQVIALIQRLLSKKKDVEIYLFSFQKGVGGKDEEFNDEIYSKFCGENIFHVKYSNNTESIIKQLSLMDLCIGMRFHFCLIGLFLNIKTIGVNYQPKIKNEFNELGLNDFCFEIDELEKVCDLIETNIDSKISEGKYANAFDVIAERKIHLNKQVDNLLKEYL